MAKVSKHRSDEQVYKFGYTRGGTAKAMQPFVSANTTTILSP
jgi:hypothetical protein